MNIKKVFTVLLLVFVVGSVGYMVVNEKAVEVDVQEEAAAVDEAALAAEADPEVLADEVVGEERQVVVYYFHGDVRCPTCHKLESYAKEAVETYFADQVAAGQLQWRPVNVDKSENTHYIKDYQLVTKSIVLSEVVGGEESKWENLDQIWNLVRDKNVYVEYIREGVSSFVGEK